MMQEIQSMKLDANDINIEYLHQYNGAKQKYYTMTICAMLSK